MNDNHDLLVWLETYFAQWCDGDWEHSYDIVIKTLDNPGWSVRIPLVDTDLEHAVFQKINIDHSESDWYQCRRDEQYFYGAGGSFHLITILNIFRAWVEAQRQETPDL